MTVITTLLTLLKDHWRWWLAIGVTVLIAWLWNERDELRNDLNAADTAANSNQVITDNVLQTVAIINTISEANQHAKDQIALESQRAQTDIKVAVANDDCAARPVPAGAAERLRRYADSLRASSGSTTTGESDR